MKKIYILFVLCVAFGVQAQEIGKAGRLLKNEAEAAELNRRPSIEQVFDKDAKQATQVAERPSVMGRGENKSVTAERSGNRRGHTNRQVTPMRWHTNFGSAEVFVRIPEYGNFSVQINDQYISNNIGKFRFFDLDAGMNWILIYQDNYLVYKSRIYIESNTRFILDYFTNYGLYLLDSYILRNNAYGFNNWDDVWNSPYSGVGYNDNIRGGGHQHNQPVYVMQALDDQSLDRLIRHIKKTYSFDRDIANFIEGEIGHTQLTAFQIGRLIDLMSFDTDKVKVAKFLYKNCVDPVNYYLIYEKFSFRSSVDKVREYIKSQQ